MATAMARAGARRAAGRAAARSRGRRDPDIVVVAIRILLRRADGHSDRGTRDQ